MAVGVVVGGALAEVAEPADEVGRVGADELEHRLRASRAPGGECVNAGRGDALQRAAACASRRPGRCRRRGVVTSVRRSWIVGRASCDERAQLAQERREVLRRRLGRVDQHVEVVERRAQVHERRVGAPQRGRQQPERARERDVLARRSRPPSRWCCRRAPARSSRRSAIAVTAREELTMKRVSAPSSSVSWLTSCARGREQRVEVLGRLAGLLALARRTAWRSPG